MKENKQTGLGIAGFICALLGLLIAWFPPISIPVSVVGITLSVVQRKKNPTGFATGGLVIGIVGLAIAVLLLAFPFMLMLIGTFA